MIQQKNKCRYSYLNRIFIGIILVLAFLPNQVLAQSQQVLGPDEFISQVKQFHPVARQAAIQVEKAGAALQAARGNFDPVIELNKDAKTFSGTRYYEYQQGGLKIPTISGVTIKSGWEQSSGDFINPEYSAGTLGYLGVEIPLLKGLITDKQRAALQQAKLYTQQSRQEQASQVNDLLSEAYQAYFQWAGAYQLYSIYEKYLSLASRRMDLVKIAYRNGDRSMADTIEAFGQWQYYQLLQQEAAVLLNTRYYELSVFLWNENMEPYQLSPVYKPDLSSFNQIRTLPPLESLQQQLLNGHPQLAVYRFKQEQLEVERKLKWQNLLPSLQFSANLLSKDYFTPLNFASSNLSANNKYGITFKTPLLLRQARGEYRQAKLKLQENNILQSQKRGELQNKLGQYHTATAQYLQQVSTAKLMRSNYESLLKIEEMKLSQGESSLFLVNARENKLLEADQKLVELTLKYVKSYYAFNWAAGLLK